MIKTIADIQRLVLEGFTDWKSEGLVDVTEKDGLFLFSYSREAQFRNAADWNAFEKMSRGLIIGKNGIVAARPFDKFFNLGEIELEPGATLEEVTVKWDGSLGILYWWDRWCVATRGSLDSEQAQWATKELYSGKYDLSGLWKRCTYLVEIVYPENRIVIDYGDTRDLIMIGARNRQTGEDYPFDWYKHDAKSARFNTTKRVEFNSLDDVWKNAESLPASEEGYVCRFSDGTRLKVKGSAYREAHKWISGVTEKSVFDAMAKGTIDDMRATVPAIYKGLLEKYISDIALDTITLIDQIEDIFASSPHSEDRKTFAMWVMEHHKKEAAYLFARLDNRDLLPLMYRERYNK